MVMVMVFSWDTVNGEAIFEGPKFGIDSPDFLVDLADELLIFFDVFSRRYSHLHQHRTISLFWVQFQESTKTVS